MYCRRIAISPWKPGRSKSVFVTDEGVAPHLHTGVVELRIDIETVNAACRVLMLRIVYGKATVDANNRWIRRVVARHSLGKGGRLMDSTRLMISFPEGLIVKLPPEGKTTSPQSIPPLWALAPLPPE